MDTTFCIRGARGTMPVCGPETVRYGGSTTCLTLETPEQVIVFDAGTGLQHAAVALQGRESERPITFLFTHFHLDHVMGLPAFWPLYQPGNRVRILADPRREEDWRAALSRMFGEPYWPVDLGACRARPELDDLPVEKGVLELGEVRIRWHDLVHPQRCLAYRVEWGGRSVVIATDAEVEAAVPPDLVRFCTGADELIFDAHYTPEEYPQYRGWGHSTWEAGVALAQGAGIGRLVLTHHSPRRDDLATDELVAAASVAFSNVEGARDNMVL